MVLRVEPLLLLYDAMRDEADFDARGDEYLSCVLCCHHYVSQWLKRRWGQEWRWVGGWADHAGR